MPPVTTGNTTTIIICLAVVIVFLFIMLLTVCIQRAKSSGKRGRREEDKKQGISQGTEMAGIKMNEAYGLIGRGEGGRAKSDVHAHHLMVGGDDSLWFRSTVYYHNLIYFVLKISISLRFLFSWRLIFVEQSMKILQHWKQTRLQSIVISDATNEEWYYFEIFWTEKILWYTELKIILPVFLKSG